MNTNSEGSLQQDRCYLLVNGYVSSLNISFTIIPNEIIILCLSFYYHLIKLVYCDDKTGNIDIQRYTLKPCPTDYRFKHIAIEIEDTINDKSVINTPYIHIWLRFGQIKGIFPINQRNAKLTEQELEIEDNNRWIELPFDYQASTKISDLEWNTNDVIVIERKQDDGTWPRAKNDDDWRERLQTGDFLDAMDTTNKCWNLKWDDILNINDMRLAKRHRNTTGPHIPQRRVSFLRDAFKNNAEKFKNVVDSSGSIIKRGDEDGICIIGSKTKASTYLYKYEVYQIKCIKLGDKDAIGIMSHIEECKKSVWINEMNGYKYWLQRDGIFQQKDENKCDKIVNNKEWKANDVIKIQLDTASWRVGFYINNQLFGEKVSIEPNLDYRVFVGTMSPNVEYRVFKGCICNESCRSKIVFS